MQRSETHGDWWTSRTLPSRRCLGHSASGAHLSAFLRPRSPRRVVPSPPEAHEEPVKGGFASFTPPCPTPPRHFFAGGTTDTTTASVQVMSTRSPTLTFSSAALSTTRD